MNEPEFGIRRKAIAIPGCKPSLHGGNLITSTGNSALDTIIGGGCPLGSILLIEEDKYCNYSRVLSKYFIAEGVQRKHGIFFASLDDDPAQVLRSVPRPVEDATKVTERPAGEVQGEDMRIAFRYNQLPKVESEIPASSNATTAYDLSTTISEADLDPLDITCYDQDAGSLIKSLKEVANRKVYAKQEDSDSQPNLLRICVNSFGSPLWYSDKNYGQFLRTTLVQLKSVVRNTRSVCLVTIPTHLLDAVDANLTAQIRNLVDMSVAIESFAASDRETNPVFKDYHGLLHIRKLCALDTMAAFCPETTDLAFKLKRKRFVIEKLHLPPELGEVEDGMSKSTPTMGCATVGGSGKSHLLDF